MTAGRVEMAPRVGLEPTTLRLRYYPGFSTWPGLSLRPLMNSEIGRRALSRLIGEIPHPLVSARSPLPNAFLFAGLRSGLPSLDCRKEGFPEFTRFFNPDYSGRLLILHEVPGDSSHTRGYICRALVSPFPSFLYAPSQRHRNALMTLQGGETPARLCICRNHKADTCHLCDQSPSTGSISFASRLLR